MMFCVGGKRKGRGIRGWPTNPKQNRRWSHSCDSKMGKLIESSTLCDVCTDAKIPRKLPWTGKQELRPHSRGEQHPCLHPSSLQLHHYRQHRHNKQQLHNVSVKALATNVPLKKLLTHIFTECFQICDIIRSLYRAFLSNVFVNNVIS